MEIGITGRYLAAAFADIHEFPIIMRMFMAPEPRRKIRDAYPGYFCAVERFVFIVILLKYKRLAHMDFSFRKNAEPIL